MTGPNTAPPRDPSLEAVAQLAVSSMATVPGTAGRSDRPDYERPEYVAGQPARDLCNDLMTSSEAIRARGQTYLKKWPAETNEDYAVRASIAHVTAYYQRTIHAAVGMIMHEPPALDDAADKLIQADWEDIDGQGTHGEVFAKYIAVDAINSGFCAILVDAPPIPDGLSLTHADEEALNLRPTWVRIPADRIISWVAESPDWPALLRDYALGILTAEQVKASARQIIVRQIVIYEPTDVPSGQYGVTIRDRYRVIRLGDEGVSYEVWERVVSVGQSTAERFDRIAEGTMTAARGQPFRQIPISVVYAGRATAPFVAAPPLLSLAELNLDHYQVTADRRYLMKLCHAPTLFLAGFQEEDDGTGQSQNRKIGPNSVLKSAAADAKASWVAADPRALDSSKDEKEELVRQMATLGMSFLGKDLRTASETATGRQLDDAAENATHATVARALQDGMEQALQFHALYRGVKAPEIKINTTYAAPTVDPQLAATLWQAVVSDRLDMDSWIEYVETGSLPDDIAVRLDVLKMAAEDAKATQMAANAAQLALPPGTKQKALPNTVQPDPNAPPAKAA